MIRFLSSDLWKHLRKLASHSNVRMAAVAYVTDTSGLGFKRGDTLIVDASDGAIRNGETSKAALETLARRGVQVCQFFCVNGSGFVFGMGLQGKVPLPLPIAVEIAFMTLLSPGPASVPAREC